MSRCRPATPGRSPAPAASQEAEAVVSQTLRRKPGDPVMLHRARPHPPAGRPRRRCRRGFRGGGRGAAARAGRGARPGHRPGPARPPPRGAGELPRGAGRGPAEHAGAQQPGAFDGARRRSGRSGSGAAAPRYPRRRSAEGAEQPVRGAGRGGRPGCAVAIAGRCRLASSRAALRRARAAPGRRTGRASAPPLAAVPDQIATTHGSPPYRRRCGDGADPRPPAAAQAGAHSLKRAGEPDSGPAADIPRQ